ncbi:hypothetical protein WMY93_005393 [Mugilogobius chulae]|uniref:N-acetyltransferase domain-containing protein n=1 Tax=Mugilogobius chulae TaxID=88201 RepID=A0AAW0PW21_9GOBI
MTFTIRAARLDDCKDIARLITELAEYENRADQVKTSQQDLEQNGFCANPLFNVIIAEVPEQHKTKEGYTKVAYLLYFFSYTSIAGKGVFVGGLYVMPEFRRNGIGKALMTRVAQLGLAAGCNELNFTVLDWNKPAQDFYFSQGCTDITMEIGFRYMRCKREDLEKLAKN